MNPAKPLRRSFASRYAVERELGRGSTATVFLAQDIERGVPVALKILRPELAESVAAERFIREVKLNARLQHPHIAPVLDPGTADGDLYFVLPYMEGGSLRDLLNREKQISVDRALDIARTIADALDYAHRNGLIHRDVKPENILFASGEACLADFGIARAIERAANEITTETGVVRGTPAYMSPEQASGDRTYDGRSDQYSLACVLYEMLAGVPAFHGATAEATVALRFHHRPEDVRVYRPSVPPAVDEVIRRALSVVPADRYATLADFSAALDKARYANPAVVGDDSRRISRKLGNPLLIGSISVAVVAALGVTFTIRHLERVATMVGDTTRIVVFPFGASTNSSDVAPQDLMYAALRRWEGITLVPLDQITDALRQRRAPDQPSVSDMRAVASALGAGRYVVGKVLRTPTGYAVLAEYRDIAAGQLRAAQLDLPSDSSRTTMVYSALADSLVLRGGSDGSGGAPTRSRNLFATQAFIGAMGARDEWDLPRADSLLEIAVSLDPQLTRAVMWQAQIRSWRSLPPTQWAALAERALADSSALIGQEPAMAKGLVLLSRGEFPGACAVYRGLIANDARSFAGWYGLGECNQNDRTVIQNSQSPSGWAFRSSYQEGVTAYAKAFQLIPATYRGFQASGYRRLRELLFTTVRQLRAGYALQNPQQVFMGAPTLDHDTLAIVPWSRELVFSGRIKASGSAAAVRRMRTTFDTIAARWASAFPNSADAKEALALSLELQGDAAALDTMGAAERLAPDGIQKLRFAVARIVLQLKFGIRGDQSLVERARSSTDSLLKRYVNESTAQIDGILAPIAAMSGRCATTSRLLGNSATSFTALGVRFPRDVVVKARLIEGSVYSGCARPDVWTQLAQLKNLIEPTVPAGTDRVAAVYLLLGGIVLATSPPDSLWAARFASMGSPVLAAWHDEMRGDSDAARRRLDQMEASFRSAPPGDLDPQGVVPEAKLRLRTLDTAAAIASLEWLIRTAHNAPPLSVDQVSDNSARVGYLVQAIALHAILSSKTDPGDARESARVVATLWRNADPELQPMVAALRDLVRK